MKKTRVAVLSDIHSNYHAFKACYDDAIQNKVNFFIFLGDYISDLAEPQKTMDLVYEIMSNYPTICLRGNREAYMLDCENGSVSFTRGSKSGSLLFTYEHLRKQDIDFFKSLKIYDCIEIEGVQFELAHATPNNDREYFDSQDGNIGNVFSQMKCKYLLTGHSHKQYIYKNADLTIVNPGSVGIPQGGSRLPKYAIIDIYNGEVSCYFREVTYDIENTIHAQYANGLVEYANYWAIGILYDIITGEERVLKLLKRVLEIGYPNDEEVWHSAAMEMGMKRTEQELLDINNGV